MMGETRVVCKICYASSNHKAVPTLTPESKVLNEGKCSVCRQGWAPIRVAKDSSLGGKWVRIRPRPKIGPSTEFQLCKNIQGSRGECPRGLDCSYAHSPVELNQWNLERKHEPRPAPFISGQYQLCKHIQGGGACPYGQRCTFAHTEEEFQEWLRCAPPPSPASGPSGGFVLVGGGGGGGGGGSLRCDICSLTCTSRRQLDDHLAGGKHRDRLQHPPSYPPPHTPAHTPAPLYPIRRRPLLSFQIAGFKMCMHVQAGRRCVYGDYCTFAHSNEELEAWNMRLPVPHPHPHPPPHPPPPASFSSFRPRPAQRPPQHLPPQQGHVVPHNSVEHQKPDMFTESSGLDDFDESFSSLPPVSQPPPPLGGGGGGGGEEEEVEVTVPPGDFANELRRRIAGEFNDCQEIAGFQSSLEGVGVGVAEVSGQEMFLTWTQPDSLSWTFEVSSSSASQSARFLQAVVLFDALATDFAIVGVWSVQYGGQQSLHGSPAQQGAGLLLGHRLSPQNKVHVKISLKPRSGVLGQLVIFDFGSGGYLARGLSVHVLNETEKRLMVNIGRPLRPLKPDLYWEQHYTSLAMPGREQDEVFDSGLAEYPLPEQIERLIEAGKYNNVENRVTKENYKRRLHNLLYLEEFQQRLDMSRYDIYDIEIHPENSVQLAHGTMYAAEGFHYVTVSVEEVLFEGGRSIRAGDSSLLLPMNQQVIHECWVEGVGRDRVTLKISDKAKQACVSSRHRASLRFVLSRTHMREMHYAVDQLDLNVVFPTPQTDSRGHDPIPPVISKCLQELKKTKLSQAQQNAINSMLDPACQQIPSLVLGPFGCGKTRTLRECILLLSLLREPTILICTHSNSAANIYIQELRREYAKRGSQASMVRIYYTGRRPDTIPAEVKPYCKFENGRLALPSLPELRLYRIVVVTLSTSRALSLMGLPRGHFSHIFVDEAAQALEPETLIPLALAGERTKVVLAGDHMQMDPPCYSSIARRYGLHVSLLERLFDHEAYSSGVGQLCKTLLTENHRSHIHIMEIPSKLFYKNKLTCRAKFPATGPQNIPPLKFIGVDGQEAQDEDSPSYYNNHEALKITEQVKLLVSGGLVQSDICVLSYYQKQVTRIRHLLRNERLGQVAVFRVDDVQGKEFRALLLSTVRTCYARDDEDLEEDAGFLTNPKLFNTAVTRAKEWLIVCGEPVTLCTVGSNRLCWVELIKKCLRDLNSFEYPNASQFEALLQTKLFTRKILEQKNRQFFQTIKKVQTQPTSHPQQPPPPPPPPAATVSTAPPVTTPPTTSPPSSRPAVVEGYAGLPPQLRQQTLRSHVAEMAAQGNDDITVSKIADELLKLSLEEQVGLVARPDVLRHRVREIESVLRRPGPTAALLNSTTVPNPILGQGAHPPLTPMTPALYPMAVVAHKYAPDLPPFLTSIIDGLTNYMKWCDMHLQNPQNNRPGLKENLSRQRANLGRQSELVNQQITMYRELLQIVRSSSSAGHDNPALRAPGVLSATQPPFIPTERGPPPPSAFHPQPPVHPVLQQQQQLAAQQLVAQQHMQQQVYQQGASDPSAGGQVRPGMAETGGRHTAPFPSQANSTSAFAYGMTSYFPKTADSKDPQVQTNLPASQPKRLSPLEAAINDVSSRSSPVPRGAPEAGNDVYLSDDEFNS